jgi:hypothetical protein
MRQSVRVLIPCLLLATVAVVAQAADMSIDITVAPKVLILSAPTQSVHIHSNMPLGSVNRASLGVTVDGDSLASFGVFADSLGFMVIKIDQDLVEPLVAPGTATFIVTGATDTGVTFEGQDTIQVKK